MPAGRGGVGGVDRPGKVRIMKTNRIISALRKCKTELGLHHFIALQRNPNYETSPLSLNTAAVIMEAESVLDDWQAEKLKKSEAFQ